MTRTMGSTKNNRGITAIELILAAGIMGAAMFGMTRFGTRGTTLQKYLNVAQYQKAATEAATVVVNDLRGGDLYEEGPQQWRRPRHSSRSTS